MANRGVGCGAEVQRDIEGEQLLAFGRTGCPRAVRIRTLRDAGDADSIVGVMGSSFGATNTLLAAAKCPDFRCAVEFAGGAMNWEHTPRLRRLMHDAAARLTRPIFFVQCANDYSVGPTRELAAGPEGTDKVFEAEIYPDFGLTGDEGLLFERDGMLIRDPGARRFLERHL